MLRLDVKRFSNQYLMENICFQYGMLELSKNIFYIYSKKYDDFIPCSIVGANSNLEKLNDSSDAIAAINYE